MCTPRQPGILFAILFAQHKLVPNAIPHARFSSVSCCLTRLSREQEERCSMRRGQAGEQSRPDVAYLELHSEIVTTSAAKHEWSSMVDDEPSKMSWLINSI